jgi:hypothetical protein
LHRRDGLDGFRERECGDCCKAGPNLHGLFRMQ